MEPDMNCRLVSTRCCNLCSGAASSTQIASVVSGLSFHQHPVGMLGQFGHDVTQTFQLYPARYVTLLVDHKPASNLEPHPAIAKLSKTSNTNN